MSKISNLTDELTYSHWSVINRFNRKELDSDSFVQVISKNRVEIGFMDLQAIIDEQIEDRESPITIENLTPIDEERGKNKIVFFYIERTSDKNEYVLRLKLKEKTHDGIIDIRQMDYCTGDIDTVIDTLKSLCTYNVINSLILE